MILPKGDEYNQVVQNPKTAFSDFDLQKCHVEVTPLGLPKPYSGGFTTTYKLKNNVNNWAVRCFTREIKDLEYRYKAIGTFLNKNSNCSFLVDAKFLNDGIKVNGRFHPVIKMKWLEGEALNDFIEKNKRQKIVIDGLAANFLNLIQKLNTYGIAHGDLQHGNILIKNNNPFLIDYDGMYFPELASLKVNEIGHPNYQHPKRTPNHYDINIDRFSSLVIYLAIKAITVRPELWDKYDNGDNLLFKNQDFTSPNNSKLFAELISIPELSKMAKNLIAVCTWEYNRIPTLNDFITQTYQPATLPTGITSSTPIYRSAFKVIDGSLHSILMQNVGLRVEVVGKITSSHNSKTKYGDPYLFLNFGKFPSQTFTIVFWNEVLLKIKQAGHNPDNWIGSYVSVTGVLTAYGERPQIAIDNPNQVQVLSGKSECDNRIKGNVVSQSETNKNSTYIPTTVFTTPVQTAPKSSTSSYSGSVKSSYTPTPTTKTPSYQTTTPKSSTPPKSTSSSSKSNNAGCVIQAIGTVIVGVIGISISKHVGGFIVGGIIGFFIASWIAGKIND